MLSITNFTKKYGTFTAVNDISFSVSAASITGFVGKNGAGKTTTLRSIVNLLAPTSGSITVCGMDSVAEAKAIKQRLSYMASDAEYYKGTTARQMFKLAASIEHTDVDEALAMAQRFELNVDKHIENLSLGNKKKVSIVLALMKNASVIVLDEPTSGLDPLMQELFFDELLKRKQQGCCILLSSHNLAEVQRYCDNVVVIDNGIITQQLQIQHTQQEDGFVVSYTLADSSQHTEHFNCSANELVSLLAQKDLKTLEVRTPVLEDKLFNC